MKDVVCRLLSHVSSLKLWSQEPSLSPRDLSPLLTSRTSTPQNKGKNATIQRSRRQRLGAFNMPRRSTVLAPTTSSIPDDFRIASNTNNLIKTFGKFSRSSLVDLVFQWLDEKNIDTCRPYLSRDYENETRYGSDDMNPYPPAESVEELKAVYQDFRDRKGGKREVIDRILEGDWRHGISLRQLALSDSRYIDEHPAGHRWTALRLVPVTRTTDVALSTRKDDDLSVHLPRFRASTFVKHVQGEISSLVKAHYHVHRSKSLPLTFVRIFVVDSPYQNPRQSPYVYTDSSRIIHLAFPDSAPFVYSSVFSMPGAQGKAGATPATDTRTLRRIVMDAIPNALSRPQERFVLRTTSLTTKSLHTLLTLRGPWRTNSANGAFSIFADGVVESGPLEPKLPHTVPPKKNGRSLSGLEPSDEFGSSLLKTDAQKENIISSETQPKRRLRERKARGLSDAESPTASKKRKLAVFSRFGTTGQDLEPGSPSTSTETSDPASDTTSPSTSSALDRLQIHLKDSPIPPTNALDGSNDDSQSNVSNTTLSLTFSGSDVLSGLRKLAELGIVDASRMPSWMTGEEGVSSAVVSSGKRVIEGG